MKKLAVWVRSVGLCVALFTPLWTLAIITFFLLIYTGDEVSRTKMKMFKTSPFIRVCAELSALLVALASIAMLLHGNARIVSVSIAVILAILTLPRFFHLFSLTNQYRASGLVKPRHGEVSND
ncbi:MAG: hypothetical protein KA104_02615 [Candidatus Pacebacteria bacterium]|jgi:hypothetical protein|nr:hypothetical protein [Candidatus Paceibacterota bacterium]